MLMEVTGPERGLQKLENLADKLDELNPGQYDQTVWDKCALFHHFGEFEEVKNLFFRTTMQCDNLMEGIGKEFSITTKEAMMIFSGTGCGRAFLNSKKAASYIRGFVANKRSMATTKDNVFHLPPWL